ncbi:MAG: transposase [Erysipelotrichaceae bacterium]|nr:transposase [Erysipelotrichaceae bacterium]
MNQRKAENKPNEIINDFRVSGINDFISLASTLTNRKQEIINSFCAYNGIRVSNDPIEGRNSFIKIVPRPANGYSYSDRFRNRIVYSLNRYSDHSFHRN